MQARRITQPSFGSGGVALADILANSVAVLLILIFLSIQVKQQQAEEQLEQTVDMSVLMARKLADSIVLDALPNSQPAYLHDYSSCAIAHDCNPYLYPIIEIYDDKVAIHHPRIYLTRSQMLADPSPFDIYMQSLKPQEISHIRVDIYGIGMFYLAVAAMREYGAQLHHWHFLGEKQSPKPTSQNQNESRLQALLREGERGLRENANGNSTNAGNFQVPEGIQIADFEQLSQLESEVLLPPEQMDGELTNQQILPEGQGSSNEESTNPNGGEQMLDELLNEFSRRRGENQSGQEIATYQGRSFRLRIPNFHPPEGQEGAELQMDVDTVELSLLRFIFAALHDANDYLRFDPQRLSTIFQQILADPTSFTAPVSSGFIEEIRRLLGSVPNAIEGTIPVSFAENNTTNNDLVRMYIRPNSAIKNLALDNKRLLDYQVEQLQVGSARVDVLLRAYPFVYKGERVAIEPNMLVLMLPTNLRTPHTLWRPIALVTPDLQEITLGFLLAGYTDGILQVSLETNQIRADGRVLQSYISTPQNRSLLQLSSSYGIALVLIMLLVGIFIRFGVINVISK